MNAFCHRLVLLLLLAASPAALAQSSIMELRKKLQGRKEAAARNYTQEMDAALQRGDLAGADKALNAAIAQGTLSQTQIDDARGRVASVVSQQQTAMMAEARAKEEASRQTTTSSPMTTSGGQSGGAASGSRTASSSTGGSSTELSRFAALFAGGYHRFTCTGDRAGGRQTGMTSYSITLKHAGTGKEWRVQYSVAQIFNRNSGNTGSLCLNDESLVGSKMEVRFNSKGEPESIKNLGNGNHCEVTDWWVTGYGW